MRAFAAGLPVPSAAALAASRRLRAAIRERIVAAGGWISFAEYMQAALYEPGLGYYSGGSLKLGAEGDFITAPALGDFFARALVATAAPALAAMARPQVLELGAGTGQLAAQLLTELAAAGIELSDYVILEPSAELKQRQRQALAGFGSVVTWVDSLAGLGIEGLVLANEVADALPFERFRKTADRVHLVGVAANADGFEWAPNLHTSIDVARAMTLGPEVVAAWPDGYESEYRPQIRAWVGSLADCLVRGALMIVDYGLSRRDYYRPERSAGTLMCHYRHRAHGDPFLYPGLQDITAWVDFSMCAEAGEAAGLTVGGFTPQGGWLLEALAKAGLPEGALPVEAAAKLKTLVLPGEMGERFKLLALLKDMPGLEIPGRDLSNRL